MSAVRAMCGLQIHVENEEVKLIRPDREDVWSKGYICPKGTTPRSHISRPDRLRAPMIREREEWREATWDEAFARCKELIDGVIERHGKSAFSYYVGNPTAHNFSLGRYIGLFQAPLWNGSLLFGRHCRSVAQECVVSPHVRQLLDDPRSDLPRTEYFLVMGANLTPPKAACWLAPMCWAKWTKCASEAASAS